MPESALKIINQWQHEGYVYGGWIPCVSGNLVFQHCEELEIDSKKNRGLAVNKVADKRRYMASLTKQDSRDFGSDNGQFHFSIIMEFGILDKTISGQIHITPEQDETDSSRNHELSALDQFKRLCDSTDSYQKLRQGWKSFQDLFAPDKKAGCGYLLEFRLLRNGLILLKRPCRFGNNAETRPALDIEEEFTLARQAFYHLKQWVHKHKHHRDNDDSITTVHLIDELLAAHLINDLRRSLVGSQREPYSRIEQRRQSRGMAHYLQSLLVTLNDTSLLTDQEFQTQQRYFQNLEQSIRIDIENTETRFNRFSDLLASLRTYLLFWLALLGPIFLIYLDKITPHVKEGVFSSLLIEVFTTASGFSLFVIVLMAPWGLYKSRTYRIPSWISDSVIWRKWIGFITREHKAASNIAALVFVTGLALVLYAAYVILNHLSIKLPCDQIPSWAQSFLNCAGS